MKMFVPDGKGGREEWKVFRGDPGPQGETGQKGDTGPKGDKGDPGTTSWSGITGKPSKFTPDAHKHTLADISDAPSFQTSYANSNSLVSRDSGGRASFATPTDTGHAATKGYVDAEVGKKADTSHKHTMADISDLPTVSYMAHGQTIARRLAEGRIRVGDPTDGDHAASKRYVDTEVGKKADATHSHSEYATKGDMNSLIRLVSSPPSSPTTGVLYLIAE